MGNGKAHELSVGGTSALKETIVDEVSMIRTGDVVYSPLGTVPDDPIVGLLLSFDCSLLRDSNEQLSEGARAH